MARDMRTLEEVSRLVDLPAFGLLRDEAQAKLKRNEDSVSRLLFRTRTAVDPIEVEYFRGFRQGVMYVVDALPNAIKAEFTKELAAIEKEGES